MARLKHFGVVVYEKPNGMKLTKDNYIKVSDKSSFARGIVYDDSFIEKHIDECLYNYDLNMKYFNFLSKIEFEKELMKFVDDTGFEEVKDLSSYDSVGYYIMVLDEYAQAYIGRSIDIKKRIQSHWSKQKQFDRLIFGNKDNSIISIDSFRAYDTTRIFVYPSFELDDYEDDLINMLDNKYLLNRTAGGTLTGLIDAVMNGKTRELPIRSND